jgi:hypothetical protein
MGRHHDERRRMAPRERISVSLLGIRVEAEGLTGIAAFVLLAALVFVARLVGLV